MKNVIATILLVVLLMAAMLAGAALGGVISRDNDTVSTCMCLAFGGAVVGSWKPMRGWLVKKMEKKS